VHPGEIFWIFLYPCTITSLRHVWTHPALPSENTPSINRSPTEASEAWLRSFVDGLDSNVSYKSIVAKAIDYEDDYDDYREYLIFGQEIYGEIPPEFWVHIEAVTGKTVHNQKRAKYFSCSC
jgi:hypothetical protein